MEFCLMVSYDRLTLGIDFWVRRHQRWEPEQLGEADLAVWCCIFAFTLCLRLASWGRGTKLRREKEAHDPFFCLCDTFTDLSEPFLTRLPVLSHNRVSSLLCHLRETSLLTNTQYGTQAALILTDANRTAPAATREHPALFARLSLSFHSLRTWVWASHPGPLTLGQTGFISVPRRPGFFETTSYKPSLRIQM